MWIFIFVIGCDFLSGCTKENDEKIELTLIHGWGSMDFDHISMRQIYADFERKNPDIELKLISMPSSDDVIDKLEDMLIIGDVPDICFTGGQGLETVYKFMVDHGYAVNLMPYIESDQEFKNSISDNILKYWTKEDGTIFSISDVIILSGYWYNSDILEKAGIRRVPENWDEFIDDCEMIKNWSDTNNKLIVPIVLDEEHMIYLFYSLLAENGSIRTGEEWKGYIEISRNKLEDVMNTLKKIYTYSNIPDDYNYRDTLETFNNGQSAFYMNGVWAGAMIDKKKSVFYSAFPSDDGAGMSYVSTGLGYILGETGDQEKIEASVQFLKYMLSEETQNRIMNETGQMASNSNIDIQQVDARLKDAVNQVWSAGLQVDSPNSLWSKHERSTLYGLIIKYMENELPFDLFINELTEKIILTRSQ